jgi:hypothetical protein
VAPDERIRMLRNQLLRTTNPEVIHIVADELKVAIDAYTETFPKDFSILNLQSLAPENGLLKNK